MICFSNSFCCSLFKKESKWDKNTKFKINCNIKVYKSIFFSNYKIKNIYILYLSISLIGASTTSNNCLPFTVIDSFSDENDFGIKTSPASKSKGLASLSVDILKRYETNKLQNTTKKSVNLYTKFNRLSLEIQSNYTEFGTSTSNSVQIRLQKIQIWLISVHFYISAYPILMWIHMNSSVSFITQKKQDFNPLQNSKKMFSKCKIWE